MYTDLMNMFMQSIEQAMETSRSLGYQRRLWLTTRLCWSCALMFRNGLPAMLLLSSVGMAFINLAVVRLILKRMGDTVAC